MNLSEDGTSVGDCAAADQAIPCFLKISKRKLLTLFRIQVNLRIFCRIAPFPSLLLFSLHFPSEQYW